MTVAAGRDGQHPAAKQSSPLVSTEHSHYDVVYIPLGAAALGGAERSLLELAGAARTAGLRPLIISGSTLAGTGFETLVAERDVELQWTEWAPARGWASNLLSAIRVFRTLRCSVIHFNTSWRPTMWAIVLAARLTTRARLVGTMRAMPDPFSKGSARRHFGFLPGLGLWKIAPRLVGRVWAHALHMTVSVNGNDYPLRLVRDFGFDPRKLRVIRNGIRPPEAIVAATEPGPIQGSAEAREPREVRLLYVGRVSGEKGLDFLLRALADLPANYSLSIVGEGPSLGSLQALTERLGVATRVHFAGFVRDPYPNFLASDIVVVPSIWEEAFGRAVIEAMFLTKPVVATRVGGMAEIFDDDSEGIYVPPRDVRALGLAIQRLGSDLSLRRTIGERARRRALKDYTLDRVAVQYMDAYASLVEKGSNSRRFAVAVEKLSPRR
jgi:glycosyltransferase involved in cell wall biosynthesis